jgi:hypothetical protein
MEMKIVEIVKTSGFLKKFFRSGRKKRRNGELLSIRHNWRRRDYAA